MTVFVINFGNSLEDQVKSSKGNQRLLALKGQLSFKESNLKDELTKGLVVAWHRHQVSKVADCHFQELVGSWELKIKIQ